MTHYYDKTQTSPLRQGNTKVKLFGKEYDFLVASGLFSREHIDFATKLLIEKCIIGESKTVLDLGCGWGVVAVILADQRKDIEMTATDISQRAVDYTKKNAKKHKLKINVFQSDLFKNNEATYDLILTNPPYVAGREVCFSFITESFKHLNKGGSLQLVARHNKGGKVLSEKMKSTFGNVETLAKSGGFRIYKSIKE